MEFIITCQLLALTIHKFAMERLTVIQLKAEAKRRGLRGYSKLRKAELINLLTQRGNRSKRKVIFVYPENNQLSAPHSSSITIAIVEKKHIKVV